MNTKIKHSLYILSLLVLLVACKKDEIPVYEDIDRVNIDYSSMSLKNDTIRISYGFVNTQKEIIDLDLLLMGYAKAYDRQVGIKITRDDGAIEGIHYEIATPVIMPKNKVQLSTPLTILRADDLLQEGPKSFSLKIIDTDELAAGIRTTLYVHISDDIPDAWIGDANWFMDKVSKFFGECSKTKYLFVYETLNVWDFSDWGIWGMMGDAAKFTPAKRILKEKLAEYEAEHGPLMDPDKGRVTFPD